MMNFKITEPEFMKLSGGIDNLLDIPMGPGRSFGTNYKLEILHKSLNNKLAIQQLAEMWNGYIDNEVFSICHENIVPYGRFQIDPKRNEDVTVLNLDNRPFNGFEQPIALVGIHADNVRKKIAEDLRNMIVFKYRTTEGTPNVKSNRRGNVGTISCYNPRRTVLSTSIRICT